MSDFSEKLITYNGKTQNLTEWAIELGISLSAMSRRFSRSKMTKEQALTQERYPVHYNTKYEFEGKNLTVREWAKVKNIPYAVLQQRLTEHKWTIEKALTQPLRKAQEKYSPLIQQMSQEEE